MNKFYNGDTVKFGVRGTTAYRVFRAGADTVDVQSEKSGTNKYEIDPARLVLVEGGPERFEAAAYERGENRPLVQGPQPNPAPVPMVDPTEAEKVLTGTVVKLVPERSSYSKAILAGLQAKAGHVFEGVSLSSKARTKRKAARRAAKISRKANR